MIRISNIISSSGHNEPKIVPITEHMAGHVEVADTPALSRGTHLAIVTLVLR